MARKILIIFAFIIAAFPFFGFSDRADTIVTTTLALFIAVTLLFSRRPRMTPLKNMEPVNNDMPSPFVNKVDDVRTSNTPENISPREINNIKIADSVEHIITPINPVPLKSVPSPLPPMPRKRVQPTQKAPGVFVEKNQANIEEVKTNITPVVRKQRKQNPRVLLAYEDQVHPADIPLSAEAQSMSHSKISNEA